MQHIHERIVAHYQWSFAKAVRKPSAWSLRSLKSPYSFQWCVLGIKHTCPMYRSLGLTLGYMIPGCAQYTLSCDSHPSFGLHCRTECQKWNTIYITQLSACSEAFGDKWSIMVVNAVTLQESSDRDSRIRNPGFWWLNCISITNEQRNNDGMHRREREECVAPWRFHCHCTLFIWQRLRWQ